MEIRNAAFAPQNERSVVKPWVMSHGTLECYSIEASRQFYEEFLGLECVRISKAALIARCGMKWHIVCIRVKAPHPCHVLNHWGIEVRTREEVDRAYADALRLREKYRIREVKQPAAREGAYSLYLQDLDHNWWEIVHSPSFRHDDHFERGDRYPPPPGQADETSHAEA